MAVRKRFWVDNTTLQLLVRSMGILVALVRALPGIGAIIGLIALAMVYLTIVAINIVFNLRR